MSEERIAIVDLADDIQVRKQRIFKILAKLGVRPTLRREETRKGQKVATVTRSEATRIKEALSRNESKRSKSIVNYDDESKLFNNSDEPGVFYVILLEPQHDPGRFKVGFTSELDGRIRKHRTAAPFAKCEKSWPSRRGWERAAIDCITEGCEQLHTEVFRAVSITDVIHRADEFFSIMPKIVKGKSE